MNKKNEFVGKKFEFFFHSGNFFDAFFQGLESINGEVNFFALYFSRFKNEFSHSSKVALNIFTVTKTMS